MKKSIFALSLLALTATTAYADTFKCYRYVDGSPTGGYIKVEADSKSEASEKALQEYKDMGKRVDYVECEY